MGLEAAMEAPTEFLNKAVKPVIVAGPKLRVSKAQKAFMELSDASGYPMVVMPSSKGLVSEHHPHFISIYWGAVSTSFCTEIVESGDACLFVGPIFNDYSSVGYSLLISKEKAVVVQPNRVNVGHGPSIGWVFMVDFLSAVTKKLKKNMTIPENYRRIFVPHGVPCKSESNEPLRVNLLFKYIQRWEIHGSIVKSFVCQTIVDMNYKCSMDQSGGQLEQLMDMLRLPKISE